MSDAGQRIEADYEFAQAEVNFDTPLPGSLSLFAGGLGLIGMLARRKQRVAASA
ncbi:MAG: PEP-CTERM sorting domain-containing protein [Xanthobacteraceae bacterium]